MLERFAQSSLSAQAFCEREAISTASFYRWRSILGGYEAQTAAKRAPHNAQPTRRSGRAQFIELGALGLGGARLEVRLDLGGGVLLSVARG
jgi:hypothetical protein